MLLTKIYNRGGKIAKKILLYIAIFGCGAITFYLLPPLGESPDNGSQSIIEQLNVELENAIGTNREIVGEISNLRGELEARERTIAGLRSTVRELEETISSGLKNNLETGDIIIEAGIRADESLQLIRKVREAIGEGCN